MITGTTSARRWEFGFGRGRGPRPPGTSAALWRPALALGLALFFAVLTVAVVRQSDLDGMDTIVLRWALSVRTPWLYHVLSLWVLLGQRGICLGIAATWLGRRALRHREIRPLITFAIVTFVMNVSVEIVKVAVGRLGPLELGGAAVAPGASHVFADGTIFPSGHTANAAVTWGLLAMLARRNRPIWGAASVFVATTVGLTTIYLGTHWVSDVLAGWAAGALILLAVPALMPAAHRAEGILSRVLPDRWRAPDDASEPGVTWDPGRVGTRIERGDEWSPAVLAEVP